MSENVFDEDVVVPAPKHKKEKRPGQGVINDRLPQLPFLVQIVGPRHSGKSYLLKHLIGKNPGMYGTFFKKDNIILYSPTIDFDDTLHELKLKHIYTVPTDVRWIVDEVIAQQDEYRKSKNMAPVLIVLDDVTQIRNAWVALEKLGFIGRHFNIHTLSIAHKMSSILRGVRTQTQQWILFRPHEQSEWQWILDMFSMKKTQDIWLKALLRAWNIQYNFVYIDFERQDRNMIYRSGFNNPLFTPEEMAQLEGNFGDDGEPYFDPLEEKTE
jgi:hypothetical protein